MNLDDLESHYLMLLVQLERAGSFKLRKQIEKQLQFLIKQNKLIENKFKKKTKLSREVESFFYSNWYYSGIRVLSSIKGMNDLETIINKLGLDKRKATEAIKFLLQTGLCVMKNNELEPGPIQTCVVQLRLFSIITELIGISKQ